MRVHVLLSVLLATTLLPATTEGGILFALFVKATKSVVGAVVSHVISKHLSGRDTLGLDHGGLGVNGTDHPNLNHTLTEEELCSAVRATFDGFNGVPRDAMDELFVKTDKNRDKQLSTDDEYPTFAASMVFFEKCMWPDADSTAKRSTDTLEFMLQICDLLSPFSDMCRKYIEATVQL